MTTPEPAGALNHTRTGSICDACNRTVRTGDFVRAYATYYSRDGWVLRRVWCEDCGVTSLEHGTGGVDEVTIEAVFLAHRLFSVRIVGRSGP